MKLSPVIQINILDFLIFKNQTIINWFLLKERTNLELVLTEDLQMIYIELPKFKKSSVEELDSGIDIWLYLLKHSQTLTQEDTMKLKNKLPDLKNAFGTLELYATDPEKQRELEVRLRSDENFAYEMAARYELGVERGKLEIARKMMEKGEPIQKILEYSNLSMDDLKKNGIL